MFFTRLASQGFVRGAVASAATATGAYFVYNQNRLSKCETTETKPDLFAAFTPKEFVPLTLARVEPISHNTHLYRFALPSAKHHTGLDVASCVVAKAQIDGKTVIRPYTPVTLNSQKGYVDFVVKSYPAPGGVFSRHLETLKEGDSVLFKGPFKKLSYERNMKKKIGMIAGGTGITPMLQVVREVLSDPLDDTELSLIFANVTEEDILLRDEIDALAFLHPNFKVYYTLDKPPSYWKGGKGYVSESMISDRIGENSEDNLVLVCGPPGFMKHVSGPKGPKKTQGTVDGLLKKLGYNEDTVYKF